jgi:nuclear protein localization family protein 4
MIIRVRSNVGVWRVEGLDETGSTGESILAEIAKTRPHISYEIPLSRDPACREPLYLGKSLVSQGLKHGAMVHCRVDPATCATADAAPSASGENEAGPGSTQDNSNMKRIIDKDGQIKLVPSNEVRNSNDDKGFRRGMMPLRDIKMAWTLNEFVAMDSQFVFKIKRQEKSFCSQVSLDSPSIQNFQSYLQRFQFARKRFAFLYGKYDTSDDSGAKKTIVEAIYEPPQEPDSGAAEGFEQLEDLLEDKVRITILG